MNRHILILFIIAAIAAVVALSLENAQRPTDPSGERFLPELADGAAHIHTIVIEQAQGESFTVARNGDQWVMASHQDYPVDAAQLSALLRRIIDAETVQAKTAQAEHYHRLGVEPIDAEGSLSQRLTLITEGQEWQLLVGSQPESGFGQYVRLDDKAQSWLVDQTFDVPAVAREWMQQPIWSVAESDIQSVRRINSDTEWEIYRAIEEQDSFILRDLPEGRELKYASVLNGLPSVLTELNFEQVVDSDDMDHSAFEPKVQLSVALFDDSAMTVTVLNNDDEHWLKLDSVQLQGPWQGRWYRISSFTARQLNKTLADFLKEPKDEPKKVDVKAVMDEGQPPNASY